MGRGLTSGADPRLNAEECLLGGGIRRWWGEASRCAGYEQLSRSSFEFFLTKSSSSLHLKRQGLDVVEWLPTRCEIIPDIFPGLEGFGNLAALKLLPTKRCEY